MSRLRRAVRMRHVARLNPPVPEFLTASPDEDVTFVPLEAVWPGDRLDVGRLRPKREVDSGYTRFAEGDILIPKITPTFEADRSTLALGLRSGFGCGTTELHVLRAGPQLNARYANYVVSSRTFLLEGTASMIGVAGQRRVPESFIEDYAVLLPDSHEQRAIADFLDAETTRIDTLVAKRALLIERVRERWSERLCEILFPSGTRQAALIPAPSQMPRGWALKKLVELTDRSAPIAYGILLPGPRLAEGVPYLGAGDVRTDKMDLSILPRTTVEIASQYPRTVLREGDLVYAIRGSFGAVERVTRSLAGANLSRDVARIRPGPSVEGRWLLWVLKSELSQEQFLRREVGATITGVNIQDLKSVRIPVPATELQVTLAEQVESEWDPHVRLIDSMARQTQLMLERRQALITAAVTREIDVSSASGRGVSA